VPGDPQLCFPAAEGNHPDCESDTRFVAGELTADSGRRFALSVLGTPVKGWDPLVVSLFGLVPAPVSEGGGSQSGSRWSARSAARTNDLEADEDPPHTVGRRNGGKDVVVQVICCLP
jgi:hypothetical protein